MHRPTVAIYEHVAAEYAARRKPRARTEAVAFARRVQPGLLRADLGCGPGRYTDDLGEPVVAFDAARAMLDLVPRRAPHAVRVRGDLEALPFRRGGLAGAWANLSYQHLPRVDLPMALAHLHHALAVGAPVEMTVVAGEGDDDNQRVTDDFPGRLFSLWTETDLCRVLEGAGFNVESVTPDEDQLRVRMTRLPTLPDFVGAGLRMLICGLNPSEYSAATGVNFARPGNRFWPAALAAGLVTTERDPWGAVAVDRIGLTDLVKRATPRADALTAAEYRSGAERLAWMAGWLRPAVICFVGLAGWRAAVDRHALAGLQPASFAGVPAYVMPSTSGVNAHSGLAALTNHLRAAAASRAG
jgi:double-stranded uracil-DNA glycosylase